MFVAGVGDVSMWEFSGYQPYYVVYDLFVGDVNCIHVIVVNLSEPRDVQLSQLLHWLHFIAARVRGSQPVGKWNTFLVLASSTSLKIITLKVTLIVKQVLKLE